MWEERQEKDEKAVPARFRLLGWERLMCHTGDCEYAMRAAIFAGGGVAFVRQSC